MRADSTTGASYYPDPVHDRRAGETDKESFRRRVIRDGDLMPGFDPTRFPTEPPACDRASWQLPGPDSHRQTTTSDDKRRQATTKDHVHKVTSDLLVARKIEARPDASRHERLKARDPHTPSRGA